MILNEWKIEKAPSLFSCPPKPRTKVAVVYNKYPDQICILDFIMSSIKN